MQKLCRAPPDPFTITTRVTLGTAGAVILLQALEVRCWSAAASSCTALSVSPGMTLPAQWRDRNAFWSEAAACGGMRSQAVHGCSSVHDSPSTTVMCRRIRICLTHMPLPDTCCTGLMLDSLEYQAPTSQTVDVISDSHRPTYLQVVYRSVCLRRGPAGLPGVPGAQVCRHRCRPRRPRGLAMCAIFRKFSTP